MHTVQVVLITNGSVVLMRRCASIICGLSNASAPGTLATNRLAGCLVMIWPLRVHAAGALDQALDALVALEDGVLGYEVFIAERAPPAFQES